jgi:hypothetical protein
VNILLLSLGGGGGNILRSAKALFLGDLAVTQKTDARFAECLRRAVTTRYLDTNEFSGQRATRGTTDHRQANDGRAGSTT